MVRSGFKVGNSYNSSRAAFEDFGSISLENRRLFLEAERIVLVNKRFGSGVLVVHKKRVCSSLCHGSLLKRASLCPNYISIVQRALNVLTSLDVRENAESLGRGLSSADVLGAHDIIVIVLGWGRSKLHRLASLNSTNLLVADDGVSGHQGVSAAFALRLNLSDITIVILRETMVSLPLHVADNRARSVDVVDLVDTSGLFASFPGSARASSLNIVDM